MDLLLYLLTGVVSGFLAGLLGIGGGLVIVPALLYTLPHAGIAEASLAQTAIGTSLAIIVLTAISSIRAHHRAGYVEWRVVRGIAPGIVIGALGGALLAGNLPGLALRWFYLFFLLAVATQMLLDWRPGAGHDLPGRGGLTLAGVVIGVVSSLVGIGGGTLSTPFLLWCSRSIRTAVATSAAIGLPIAVAGATGFVLAGWGNPAPGTVGYVAVPAMLTVGAVSVLFAPFGARVAHQAPTRTLKRWFAGMLLLLAARMAWGLLVV